MFLSQWASFSKNKICPSAMNNVINDAASKWYPKPMIILEEKTSIFVGLSIPSRCAVNFSMQFSLNFMSSRFNKPSTYSFIILLYSLMKIFNSVWLHCFISKCRQNFFWIRKSLCLRLCFLVSFDWMMVSYFSDKIKLPWSLIMLRPVATLNYTLKIKWRSYFLVEKCTICVFWFWEILSEWIYWN